MYDEQLVLTMQQVMKVLQCSRSMIERMMKAGELGAMRRDSQRARILFLRADVMELVERMKAAREVA